MDHTNYLIEIKFYLILNSTKQRHMCHILFYKRKYILKGQRKVSYLYHFVINSPSHSQPCILLVAIIYHRGRHMAQTTSSRF